MYNKPIKKTSTTKKKSKVFTKFRVRVRSRHPSHDPLRSQLPLLPFRSVVRLGSTTVKPNDTNLVECNTPEAVRNSANKLRMKEKFVAAGVKTAQFWRLSEFVTHLNDLTDVARGELFPIVTKSLHGSRGKGNRLHRSEEDFRQWFTGKDAANYIVERFHNYNREYRLHVTKAGCFYTCRKMLKQDTPEEQRWFRNDSNSVWIKEDNPQFDRPVNWEQIKEECVKALLAVGLDIGACDVKVQSAKTKKGKDRPSPEFFIIEINSAPSFGDVTLEKYLEEIPRVLKQKFVEKTN